MGTDALLLVSMPGTYTVTVTGANGCFDITSIVITQNITPPNAPLSAGDQSECTTNPIQTLTASATAGAGESIVWYDAASGGNIVVDPSLSAVGSVTYPQRLVKDRPLRFPRWLNRTKRSTLQPPQ